MPKPPKGMNFPFYIQGWVVRETLKTGFYESTDLDKFYKEKNDLVPDYKIKSFKIKIKNLIHQPLTLMR